jgi:hypothetical protein
MTPRPRTVAFVLALLAVAGCTLNKSELRRETGLTRFGGGGQIIEPKRCALQIAILSRPLHDPAIDVALWDVADEQVLAPEVRHALEVNGLRVGLITGDLPAEIESILRPAQASPEASDPSHARTQVVLPDGDHVPISLGDQNPVVTLLLNRDNRAYGKDYQDASGWVRVTPKQEGATGVALRLVPEIHHGPIQHAFSGVPTGGSMAPQRFMVKDGQEEETLRELTSTLTLQPGQVAVLGCRPDHQRSLGTFLFTQPEVNSDRLLQKVLLIWASRSSQGLPALEPIDPPDSDMPQPQTGRSKDENLGANGQDKSNNGGNGSKPATPKGGSPAA